MGKNALALALAAGLFFAFPKRVNAESLINFNLFPKEPLHRLEMVDPDLLYSGIKLPTNSFDLEKTLETPISDFLPYCSLAKNLPLVSVDINKHFTIIPKEEIKNKRFREKGIRLSKRVLTANLMAGGLIKFPKENEDDISYKAKLELFVESPEINDYSNKETRFYLTGGWIGEGSIKIPNKNLLNENLSSIAEIAKSSIKLKDYSFFADAYIVGKSPYSDQYLIARIGINNLFNTTEKPNVYFSEMWESGSILPWFKKISPYISFYIEISPEDLSLKGLGQLGLKFGGESNRAIDIYGQVNYSSPEEPWEIFYGAKFKL